jgi:hypothetical protein
MIIQESEIEFKIIDDKFIAITQLSPRRGQIVLPLENVSVFAAQLAKHISHWAKKKEQTQNKTRP